MSRTQPPARYDWKPCRRSSRTICRACCFIDYVIVFGTASCRPLTMKTVPDTYILGIESSCDETAAAVVRSGEELISNVVYSQFATHQPYGGVVPELASREHLRAIVPVVRK